MFFFGCRIRCGGMGRGMVSGAKLIVSIKFQADFARASANDERVAPIIRKFVGRKAAEGSRTPRPVGGTPHSQKARSVLECGCPLPLSYLCSWRVVLMPPHWQARFSPRRLLLLGFSRPLPASGYASHALCFLFRGPSLDTHSTMRNSIVWASDERMYLSR